MGVPNLALRFFGMPNTPRTVGLRAHVEQLFTHGSRLVDPTLFGGNKGINR